MLARLKAVGDKVREQAARKAVLSAGIAEKQKRQAQLQARAENTVSAKDMIVSVAAMTQQNIGQRISELVSLALASVWEDPYELEVEFVQRRGGTEADLFFVRNGNRIEPLFNSGGGVVDVASIALRLAVWSLNPTSPVFILDEPFRNLHGPELNEKASLMLQALSRQLGIQVIMAAADDNMIHGADKVFHVGEEGIMVME